MAVDDSVGVEGWGSFALYMICETARCTATVQRLGARGGGRGGGKKKDKAK